jgi:hypothetical protein
MNSKYLVTYLRDHLAGSEAGLRRFQAAAKKNEGTPLGRFLDKCVAELLDEREVLRTVLKAAGGTPPLIKQPLAFVGERMARLKPNGHLLRYSPLSRLEDLEALRLGVEGKMCMWRAMYELSRREPKLNVADFEALFLQAEQQAERLERFRVQAALLAFGERGKRLKANAPSRLALSAR